VYFAPPHDFNLDYIRCDFNARIQFWFHTQCDFRARIKSDVI